MASEMQQLREQGKQKAIWLNCDPVTLVAAAREQLYTDQGEEASVSPIEEVLTRFEHQTRAVIGTGSFTSSPS